jgi:uncharacterized membrane protein (UPF0182 family)
MTTSIRYALLLTALLLFLGGPTLMRLYTDWLWFVEVGYEQVFLTMLRTQVALFVGAFVCAVAWLWLNLRQAVGSLGDVRAVFTTREGLEITVPGRRQLRALALGAAALLSILVGLFAAGQWETWLAWRHGMPFGEVDPLLGHEVRFYVFSLPFQQLLRGLLQTLVVVTGLATGGVYLLAGGMTSRFAGTLTLASGARRHLSLLGAVLFLLLAWGAWLQRAEYLVDASSPILHGASYADVHARMPAALVAMAVAVLGAGLALLHAFSARIWPVPAAVGLYLVVTIGGQGYASLLQRFGVDPNQQVRETPYIVHNIAATRRAFGLDQVEARPLSGEALLTQEDIANNGATLENVRLWDHQPLLETFGQLQEIRTYYDFVSVDNDRYRINGELRQVMLSPRELNSGSLPSRTWVNERLTYTHGYGLTLGPVNEVDPEGLPVLFVQDLPPTTTAGIQIDEPSIYFGELSNEYAIVRTEAAEFHYPSGEDNVSTRYEGTGGVSLGSLWRRLAFALRFGAYQIVLNQDIGPESRILFNRLIADRVTALAPFIPALDQDPYMVVAEGRLFWIYDAYTTSARYPYSTPAGGVSYIRNSVKFVIDAYHGTITAYLADPDDPIAATWARVFPDLFRPLDEMPPTLRAHVRYPEDIFALQSRVFTTYHMTQPAVFYNREDQWEVPVVTDGGESITMQPYYTIMRLPGESEAEFIQMLPFTPRGRDNLAAWLVARSDGEHYGRLGVFEFPKQKVVFGPSQVVSRIAQDQIISPQITLWNQQGSQVLWGTLMVIPVEESLIYVRPLYLRASGSRIPELTRVIVAYENRIVMEETLEAGLAELFGGTAPRGRSAASPAPTAGDAPAAPGEGPDDLVSLADRARAHYDRAVAAQRAGDWTTYGRELQALGEILERMEGP